VDEEGEECPRAVNNPAQHVRRPRKAAGRLTDAAVADRRGIGFGWLQNAWLLHARLNILTRGPGRQSQSTQKTRGPVQA
jgi:hypothetical protein